MMTKKELRNYIRQRRALCSATDTAIVVNKLRRELQRRPSQTVLAYNALPDEVQTAALLDEFVGEGREVLLPRVTSDTEMELCRYTDRQDLRAGAFGIMEPIGERFTDYEAIDVALIPGMAFDREGHRLGRGRGYYDRLLAHIPYIYKIGVCFPFQLLDHVPTDAHDIPMDCVIC